MTISTKRNTSSIEAADPTPTTPTTPTVNPADIIFVKPPPAEANIPSPPAGFNPPAGTNYHAVRPKKLELTSMPDAVTELRQFTDFQATLGKAAPPYQSVLQMFDAASQWSTMRDKSAAWDIYCATMEGVVWTGIREQMDRMKPVYAVAVRSDPSLAQKYPQLTRLLDAKQVIARKAVSTRRANKLAVLEGKMPTHGAVGKQRKRAADKAAVAQAVQQQQQQHQQQQAGSTAGSSGPAPTTTQPATQTTAPAPQPAPAPVVVTAPAPAQSVTPAPVVNGANAVNGSNGVNSSNAVNGANGVNGVNGAAQHS